MPPREAIDVPLADGRHLRVARTPGRGRPLVLLHGLLDDASGWAGVMARAAEPCVAVDLPGFGRSCAPRDASLEAYAADVAEALEHLGIAHATVVGHSLGGGVAAALAQRSPAVDALALLAPVGFGPIRAAELAALPGVRHGLQAALPLGLGNPLVVTAAYSTLVAHRRLPSADLVARLSRGALRAGRGARMAVQAIAAAGRDATPFAFDGPVAAVWGSRDALVPLAHAAVLQRAYPQARVEIWDGMGHHPQRERPAELDRLITRVAWSSRTRAAARWSRPGPVAPERRKAA